jgi:hypothetical protein
MARCSVSVYSSELEFKLNDVCIRKINCIKNQSSKIETKCMCTVKQYQTLCGNRFCARNQKSCRKFESKISENKSLLLEMKFCA